MHRIWLIIGVVVLGAVLATGQVQAKEKPSAKLIPKRDEQQAVAVPAATAAQSGGQTATEQAKPAKAADEQPVAEVKAPETKPAAGTKPKPVAKPKAKAKGKAGNALGLGGALSGSSNKPIRIVSNRLIADDKAGTVTFIGKVKAVQGDTTLFCDELIVYYSKIRKPGQNEQDAERELTRIETRGHVKVMLPDQVAYGQTGIYQIKEGLIVLKGSPKIVRGENTLAGDKIVVYLRENRAIVEGGRQMVEAVIVPAALEKGNHSGDESSLGGPATGIGTVSAGNN